MTMRPKTAPASDFKSSTGAFDWRALPKEKVQLFDSEKLNSDPTMLTYLANDLLDRHQDDQDDDADG